MLIQCGGCGLPYMPEVPSEAAVETDFEWSESFARERYERWMRNPWMRAWTALVTILRPSRESRALRVVRRFAPGGRLLDVGCGDGRLAALAQKRGFDATGIELSPKMAAKARWRLGDSRVILGRLEACELPPGSFDVIVTVSFLEHEPAPGPALQRMLNLLRPGGVCVQKTPNYDSSLRKWLGRRWSGYRWPEHVQYFSPDTLTRLLESHGMSVVGVQANSLSDNFWIAARKPS